MLPVIEPVGIGGGADDVSWRFALALAGGAAGGVPDGGGPARNPEGGGPPAVPDGGGGMLLLVGGGGGTDVVACRLAGALGGGASVGAVLDGGGPVGLPEGGGGTEPKKEPDGGGAMDREPVKSAAARSPRPAKPPVPLGTGPVRDPDGGGGGGGTEPDGRLVGRVSVDKVVWRRLRRLSAEMAGMPVARRARKAAWTLTFMVAVRRRLETETNMIGP
jgi:hypothetical protein